ncbi:MAG: SDR family NAD(P)-dependent oxidoreductase [bacterium]
MSEWNNHTIIVTGAAGGIGQAICKSLAEQGARVVLAGRSEDSLQTLATEIGADQSRVVPTDITDPEQVQRLVDDTVSTFGKVDAIINNAGGGAALKKAEDTPYDEWVNMLDFNLTGTFNCCMAAGRQMIEQGSGNIINISSTAGTKGNPFMLHYSAAKAGVLSLTNNLAFMWAEHNIRVNAVVPGTIATPNMIEWGAIPPEQDEDGNKVPRLSRPPAPEDVASVCTFLCSPGAEMITGESIPVRAWFRPDRFWN